ncbi:hypothetical protein [Bacillus sp. AFS041924]|uniref:hypothetical protein n=1 Tax=Bacillus sp. AFS041924 TaxID=2033503 RepID=UPI000BFB14E5|nr:hypothetical protein [Bacillus sp. AFS041924]PGS54175.1 hypothetical protein COC46_05530 [Bacillus sp. AFS041924]
MSIEFRVGKDYENGSIIDVLHDLGFQEDGRAFTKDGLKYSYKGCDKYQSYVFSVTMSPIE